MEKKQRSNIKTWRKVLSLTLLAAVSISALISIVVMIVDNILPGSHGYAALAAFVVMLGVSVVSLPILVGSYFMYPVKQVKYWAIALVILLVCYWLFVWISNGLSS